MSRKYQVESEFADLHENVDPFGDDVEVDIEDSDNEIVKAALRDEKDSLKAKDGQPDEDDDDLFDDISPTLPDDFDEEDEDGQDEDGDEEEDTEDEDDEEDADSYSKKVRKRIEREKRRADRERERREALEQRFSKIEAKLAQQANEDAYNLRKDEIEGKIAELKKKKAEAYENGDTDAQVEIDDQMLDLRTELRFEKSKLKEAQETKAELDSSDDGIDYDKLAPKAREWVEAHPSFKSDKRFQRAVLAADSLISSKGSNPNTDKHYEKIQSLVEDEFPQYFDKKTQRPRRKPPVQESGRKAPTKRSRRPGKVVITRTDKANMMRFGLDPQNPKHIREYARNKRD